mmetsp:Transcript_14026/g.45410  ORF Transcript_14026/g.45410 Transcript_14026/m.45410 type:complete len:250 (-) Transcript_14026:489-1238(-)
MPRTYKRRDAVFGPPPLSPRTYCLARTAFTLLLQEYTAVRTAHARADSRAARRLALREHAAGGFEAVQVDRRRVQARVEAVAVVGVTRGLVPGEGGVAVRGPRVVARGVRRRRERVRQRHEGRALLAHQRRGRSGDEGLPPCRLQGGQNEHAELVGLDVELRAALLELAPGGLREVARGQHRPAEPPLVGVQRVALDVGHGGGAPARAAVPAAEPRERRGARQLLQHAPQLRGVGRLAGDGRARDPPLE